MTHTLRRAAAIRTYWDPSSVSGLQFWVQADDLALNDGDTVSAMADKSGNGRNATLNMSSLPLYKAATFNSAYPAVRSDGTTRGLGTSTVATTATDNFTMFCAVQKLTLTDGDRVVFHNGAGGSNGVGISCDVSGTPKYGLLRGGVAWHAGTTTPDLNAHIYVCRRASGTMKLWVDGGASELSTASNPNAPGSITSILYNGFHSSQSDLAEAGIYNVALSDAETNLLGGYMAARYGLTWTGIS